jgi:carbon-monoxide dehydrogenase small subunit
MSVVTLVVNGRSIAADVEPRQHLGDFLREQLLLTGTHLGCEHGVCGACTVLIDGAPARSCIAFPVALDGAAVTTIEGLAEDPVMVELREAFSREHALQCGYCTPGMLLTARDIVLRHPGADLETIRHELAGNLCRCTGYVGIIRAVQAVATRHAAAKPAVTRGLAAPLPGYPSPLAFPVAPAPQGPRPAPPAGAPRAPAPVEAEKGPAAPASEPLRNPVRLAERFEVPAQIERVWGFFQDPGKVIACLPGARLSEPSDGRSFRAEMTVKLGPIAAAFHGAGTIDADQATRSGTIRGSGKDGRSASRVQAELAYRLAPAGGGAATTVDVDIAYALQGPLAQVSRGALARVLARRLTESFAQNLAAALTGAPLPGQAAPLDGGSLLLSMIRSWISRLFGR